MDELLDSVRRCSVCRDVLPFGPNPVVRASRESRIIIIGQAPGTKVHRTGIPWNDPSGDLLREWMQLDRQSFYDETRIALMPMAFCYPGKGKSGDLPPRPECAPLWHSPLMGFMKQVRLTLLVGQYSQKYYLGKAAPKTLTETVRRFRDFLPEFFPLPHPSPRNRYWLMRNPWFGDELLPVFREVVRMALE